MREWYKKSQKSQNLIECLIALGLFFMFASGFAALAVRYTNAIAKAAALDAIKATAMENLEAMLKLSYENFSLLADGDYDLNPSGNSWQLSAATADFNCHYRCRQGQGAGKAVGFYKCKNKGGNPNKDCYVIMQYQKRVNIKPAARNGGCELDSDGDSDPDAKFVTVTFDWIQNSQPFSKSFTQYFTNWKNPSACSAAPYGQAASLAFDNGKAVRQDGYPWFYPLTTVDRAIVKNSGSNAVVIDKVQISWTPSSVYPPTQLYDFSIGGATAWYWWGYKPNGLQLSGATLDIANYGIPAKKQKEIRFRVVNIPSQKVNFSVNFIMEDGSQIKTTLTPYPPAKY